MSKYKLKASLLLDGLLGFYIIVILSLVFIPMLTTLNSNYLVNLKTLEIKKVILVSIKNYSKDQLKQGVEIDQYEIQLYKGKLCGKDSEFKIKACVSL